MIASLQSHSAATPTKIKAYYQNMTGLNGKSQWVLPLTSLATYDLIFFTETWLCDGFHDSEIISLEHYYTYRNDRSPQSSSKSIGGGVMIAAKSGLRPTRLPHFERPDLEMVWVCLELVTPIYVCCIYLPNALYELRKISSR